MYVTGQEIIFCQDIKLDTRRKKRKTLDYIKSKNIDAF